MSETRLAIDIDLSGQLGSFSFEVKTQFPLSGVTVVFGPSGCGKTTLLRAIAGFEQLEGKVVVGDQPWQTTREKSLPTHKRKLGMVFQEPRLFNHLTVKENALYGFRPSRNKQSPKLRQPANYYEVVSVLGIEPLLDRYPDRLSGGEKQRVAIARALFCEPDLLLMDEPLAALDDRARHEVLACLERLRLSLSTPLIYVTHSHTELAYLADHVVVMNSGRIVTEGSYLDVLTKDEFLAGGQKQLSVFEAMFEAFDREAHIAQFRVVTRAKSQKVSQEPWVFEVPMKREAADSLINGSAYRLCVDAADVSVSRDYIESSSVVNQLPVHINRIGQAQEGRVNLHLNQRRAEQEEKGEQGEKEGKGHLASPQLIASITTKSLQRLALAEGDLVWAHIKGMSLAR